MKEDFSKFVFGLFIGIVLVLFFLCLLDAGNFTNIVEQSPLLSTLTIIATLIAGYWAFHGTQKQIADARESSEQIRSAKLRASLSVLPAALSRIHEVAAHNISLYVKSDERPSKTSNLNTEHIIEFDSNTIETLKNVIEYSKTEQSERLSQILSVYQIAISRMRDCKKTKEILIHNTANKNLYYQIMNWLEVITITDNMFEFARNRDKTYSFKIDAQAFMNSLSNVSASIPGFHIDEIQKLIQLSAKKNNLETKF